MMRCVWVKPVQQKKENQTLAELDSAIDILKRYRLWRKMMREVTGPYDEEVGFDDLLARLWSTDSE